MENELRLVGGYDNSSELSVAPRKPSIVAKGKEVLQKAIYSAVDRLNLKLLVLAVGISSGYGVSEVYGGDKTSQVEDYMASDYNFSSDSDTVLLARMIFGEARRNSRIEQIAVAHTALTRAKDKVRWNGTDIRSALLTPKQYSCFNDDDPNREILEDPMRYDSKRFKQCLVVAEKVLNGEYKDPTNGATHYHAPSANPKWARAPSMRRIGRINVGDIDGDGEEDFSAHTFFKEVQIRKKKKAA